MNKFYSGLLAAFFTVTGLQAQTITANKTQLVFGNATEIASATQQITISNPLNYAVNVKNIRFFTIYGEPAFTVSNNFPMNIAAGGSQTVTVTFAPKHNIAHNSEMVIETDSHGGNLSVDLTGQGKYSRAYYNNSENLSEEPLKLALKGIISSPFTSLGYNSGRDKMFMNIDNKKVNGQAATVNTLECIYTGRIISGFTSRTQAQNAPMNFNTEHTYPQSKFNEAEPMKSDIHHLFPTDAAANNSRNNYPFGVATLPYVSDAINTPSHLGSNLKYEPRDQQKGATARAMLYFVIRYPEPVAGNYEYQTYFAPQEAILKTWNKTFVPTSIDVKRNDDVQSFQQNRNPFVDYPQLAARITNFVSTSSAPASYELYQEGVVNYGFINSNTTYTYNYVLVNNGNQTMNFTNPALSDPTKLSFAAGTGTNFTIAPGEAYNLKVNVNLATTDSISETLTFGSNIPGKATYTVPVYANKYKVQNPLGVGKDAEKYVFNLFPNPVTDELAIVRGNQFGTGNFAFEVIDAMGKTVLKGNSKEDITTLNVADLKRGVYFLRIQNKGELQTKRFVKL